MEHLLGWKNILRPIRDGYRHLFPSPDTGPTPEEREKQRALDRTKGFTYFDTFEQLEGWQESNSDTTQRSNTPLVERNVTGIANQRSRILLCHDYAGNYQEYEATQAIGVEEERYSCAYLNYVDTFVYFSHKLACVPPPSWTNSLHRNGVRVLGTFLIEPQTKDNSRMLQMDENMVFPIARKLAYIAKYFSFDGWIVNIEKPFPKEVWDYKKLEAFLQQLKEDLGPQKSLIWYDALTWLNAVDYQNALTPQNLSFSKACGTVLTNYSWDEKKATDSKASAERSDMSPADVFLGIDVWAQSSSSRTHPRITYPRKGGGGTNTGLAVEKLAELGLSAGIFGPAWSFEHFETGKNGRIMEKVIWEGTELPVDLECSCGKASIYHPPNTDSPIVEYAEKYPAGSKDFFYSNFSRAFGCHEKREGDHLYEGKPYHSQLASHSVFPNIPRRIQGSTAHEFAPSLSYHLDDLPGHSRLVVEIQGGQISGNAQEGIREQSMSLFGLNMPARNMLQVRISFRCPFHAQSGCVGIYFQFEGHIEYLPLQACDTVEVFETTIIHLPAFGNLQEFGMYMSVPMTQRPERVLELLELCITNDTKFPIPGSQSIQNIQLKTCQVDESKQTRISWEYIIQDEVESQGTAFSEITGPFSHFDIRIGDMLLGSAYALEYVLRPSIAESLFGDDNVVVIITGVGFDGKHLAESTATLSVGQ